MEQIKILIADDTLLKELGMDAEAIQEYLEVRLDDVRKHFDKPNAKVVVTFLNELTLLKNVLFTKQWDFIALDNKWEDQGGGGEIGFQMANKLRSTEGPNRNTPLCVFSNQDWLEKPQNIDRIYKLDNRIGAVGSFADFFPKPSTGNEEADSGEVFDATSWLRSFSIQLIVRIKACFLLRALGMEVIALQKSIASQFGLIGSAPKLNDVIEKCRTLASTDVPILLQGETGTGKGLVAKFLHAISNRKEHPFVDVNCSAISSGIFEAELFGSVKGAFNDARDRPGFLEAADQGTLFLDEIGDLPLEQQAKLLKAIEEKTFYRVGSTKKRQSDFRVISGTHKPLHKAVKNGDFREDLYHRLNRFPIEIPALRDRPEDIPVLAKHFLEKHSNELNATTVSLSAGAMEELINHNWPGNIRELDTVIARAVTFNQDVAILDSQHIVLTNTEKNDRLSINIDAFECGKNKQDENLNKYISRIRRELKDKYIQCAMVKYNGKQNAVAQHLGISGSDITKWKQSDPERLKKWPDK